MGSLFYKGCKRTSSGIDDGQHRCWVFVVWLDVLYVCILWLMCYSVATPLVCTYELNVQGPEQVSWISIIYKNGILLFLTVREKTNSGGSVY